MSNTVQGSLCARLHDDGTGHSLRFASNGTCVECHRGFDRLPVGDWLERNIAMLRRVEPDRRNDYLRGVEIACGEAAMLRLAKAVER